MYNDEEIKQISEKLAKFNFFPLKISKNPTWVNSAMQNGIESVLGQIKTFKIEMGERIYERDMETITKEAIAEVFSKKEENREEAKQEEEAPRQIEQAMLPVARKENVGILPDFFTEALMEKWKKLTGIRRLLDVQHTPLHQVYEVQIGNERGKPVMASYVKGNYMISEANYVFLFDWNYEIAEVSVSETGVSVRGVFVGNLDGKTIKKSSVGYQERNKKMDAQQAQKAALTDAIKKALSYMGFNRDVYGGEI